MSTLKRWFLCAAVLFAGLCPALALTGTPPTLANAVQSGDQFQFTLRGQTNVIYIIESSSDLRTWTPTITNSDSHANRTITVPAATGAAFWRIRRAPEPVFSHAIAARGTINLGGGTGVIDSFDSADTNYSTGGQYDPAKRKPGGHIASYVSVDVGNMEVAGIVSTEPRRTVTIGPSGGVGSLAWLSNPANRGTIEPGYLRGDMNFAFAPATLPADFSPVPQPVPQNFVYPPASGTNYKYVILVDGDYRIPAISLSSSNKMMVKGRARLLVDTYTSVSGADAQIIIAPGSSIEWYCRGRIDLGGSGAFNQSGYASSLAFIALSTAPVTYGGRAQLIGTIYAPLSTVALAGTTDLIGAVVCNNLTLSGGMGIHFDENLMRVGPWR